MNEQVFDLRYWPDTKIWANLNCAGYAIFRLRELELAGIGLTIEQSSILNILNDRDQKSAFIQELVDVTIHQPNSVYTLINRMEKSGLVYKVERSEEKRLLIIITREGENLLKQCTNTSLKLVFSILSDPEKARLAKILLELIRQARELLGIPYKVPLMQYLDREQINQKPKSRDIFDRGSPIVKLWGTLNITTFAISRLRELELARFGLTLEQYSTLHILRDHHGSITNQELVDETLRQPNSVYTLINRMVKMGLVTKIEKPDEKRASIELTQAGTDIMKNITNTSVAMAFSVLNPEDKIELIRQSSILIIKARDLLGIPYKISLFPGTE